MMCFRFYKIIFVYKLLKLCSEFEVDCYGKFEEVIELQYHNEQNRVFYSNAIGMTPLTEKLK